MVSLSPGTGTDSGLLPPKARQRGFTKFASSVSGEYLVSEGLSDSWDAFEVEHHDLEIDPQDGELPADSG
jgi:hypothetical protein